MSLVHGNAGAQVCVPCMREQQRGQACRVIYNTSLTRLGSPVYPVQDSRVPLFILVFFSGHKGRHRTRASKEYRRWRFHQRVINFLPVPPRHARGQSANRTHAGPVARESRGTAPHNPRNDVPLRSPPFPTPRQSEPSSPKIPTRHENWRGTTTRGHRRKLDIPRGYYELAIVAVTLPLRSHVRPGADYVQVGSLGKCRVKAVHPETFRAAAS